MVNSPFGSVLVAIRENEQRAAFQSYAMAVQAPRPSCSPPRSPPLRACSSSFTISFRLRRSSPPSLSGELLAMVVIGGMHSFLGPALGAVFYIIFREFLSLWTPDWLLYFGFCS